MSKAREALNELASYYDYDDYPKILQVLVDRDEAKQVNHLHPLKSFGKCPSCNKSVHILHHRQFCGECGTRLEWSKDE